MSRLELLQQYLQQWDPLETSKHWLYGADTLSQYDEASLLLDQAIEKANLGEVCFALEVASLTKDDGVVFALEHHSVKSEGLQERYHTHLLERSKHHEDHAISLMTIFRKQTPKVRRRTQPRKQ